MIIVEKSEMKIGQLKILDEIAKLYKKPTIYNLQSGHCLPVGTIPMGAMCYLDATNKTVRFDYSNCEDNK